MDCSLLTPAIEAAFRLGEEKTHLYHLYLIVSLDAWSRVISQVKIIVC